MLGKILNDCNKFLNTPIRNKHLIYGAPFFIFMGVGLLIMQQCATVRYQFKRSSTLTAEELKASGFKKKHETLEEMYEKYKQIDLDNWENKRIPRPWDEEGTIQN